MYRLTWQHHHFRSDDPERTNPSLSVNHAEFETEAEAEAERARIVGQPLEEGIEFIGAEVTVVEEGA